MLCTVLTASRSSGIASGLTYETDDTHLELGRHVRVPLRRSIVDGIVIDIKKVKAQEKFDVKRVQSILGEKPYLTEAQIKTLRWMSEYYHCSLRQALQAWLPSPPWDSLLPKEIHFYSLQNPNVPLRGQKQKAVCDALQGGKKLTAEQIRLETGASTATIRSLEEKSVLVMETQKEQEDFSKITKDSISYPALTEEQKNVCDSVRKDDRPSLLFGVTGSGKTEIYAALIADATLKGKQSILLVPEILLTEHCIHRFQKLLGAEHVAVVHSRLTASQRRRAWRRIHSGAISLVIGSRSALFVPMQNLDLVILDEEHEWTYKNEQTPRYHARETAEALCRFSGAKLLLGSATPSLESWARAKSGRYNLTRLDKRYSGQPFPTVKVIDLASITFGSLYPFSPTLLDAIKKRLEASEQSILFLNRRGTASALLCLDCRRRVVSPDSQLPFTVHRSSDGSPYLMDHTTGTVVDTPTNCPACGSARLHTVGAGTQKIESILERQFPEARILRADRDTLTSPEKMRLLLKKMRERDADILLGTQSVVKGLDLPGVTLAAVLLADIGLSLPHFRAGERIFQLLTQLTGRSGRAQPGEVIIQTFRPDAPEVQFAAEHKTEEYLEQELKLRLYGKYPPGAKMVRLLVRGTNPALKTKELMRELTPIAQKHDVHISASPTLFGGGKVWHILLRGTDPAALSKQVNLDGIVVDIDPIECV